MSITMPAIEIKFRQLASTFIQRSERGTAVLIIKDDTEGAGFVKYTDAAAASADKAYYTAANMLYITDALSFKAKEVYVVKIPAEGAINDALTAIKKRLTTGWITIADGTKEEFEQLKSWIVSQEAQNLTYKAVVFGLTAPDCMHIVNLVNEKVTFNDARGEVSGEKYTPSLAGMLAGCNVEQGATGYLCSNLSYVQEVEDRYAALDKGEFILYNDDESVKAARGINSLTTLDGSTKTEDMRFIDIVEAMDLIKDDISSTWRDDYCGKYKNLYDNQVLFISAVNGYFRDLADENVLDKNYDNLCSVDVEEQRSAWLASGKSEAASWDEAKVRNMTFKRKVFLSNSIKILGAMEDLKFVSNLA